MGNINFEQLRLRLDHVASDFDRTREISNDPISHVMAFKEPQDREVGAFIAAVFSYGNVKQIQATLKKIFALLGARPALKLHDSDGKYWRKVIPKTFRHRFNSAEDLGCFLTWIGEALRSHGNLENFFLSQNKNLTEIGQGLENFIEAFTNLPCKPYAPQKQRGVYFLLSRPSKKSACKRLLLFLRWVVGTGSMDLGLWKNIPKHILLIPVDTHVLRISRHLGLTKRKDNSWRTAQEITDKLKTLDPRDPTRFDFALCHLGISQECPSRFKLSVCGHCRMNDLCLTYSKKVTA
jgi:uncharacterized protein (TIGR02757 family)